jgi:hypothetical protein
MGEKRIQFFLEVVDLSGVLVYVVLNSDLFYCIGTL